MSKKTKIHSIDVRNIAVHLKISSKCPGVKTDFHKFINTFPPAVLQFARDNDNGDRDIPD